MCDGQLVRGEAVHIPDGWNRQAGMASVAAASWHPGGMIGRDDSISVADGLDPRRELAY